MQSSLKVSPIGLMGLLKLRLAPLAAIFLLAGPLYSQDFPPVYIEKVAPGGWLYPFDIPDLSDKSWSLKTLRGKPVIIITAHRDLRYDLRKWSDALQNDFGQTGSIHLLWVQNLSRFPWDVQGHHAKDLWNQFKPRIPLLLDWHSLLGRSLKICYDIPNIVGIDSLGRLNFHEMGPFEKRLYERVAERIRRLLRPSRPDFTRP